MSDALVLRDVTKCYADHAEVLMSSVRAQNLMLGKIIGVGAAMTTEQETQSVQMIAMVPLLLPLLLLVAITNEPLGGIATTLGLVPFTSPITMPMRVAASPIPAAQVALSIVLLAAALGALTWLAGKIYRIGILSTGRRASMREIVQWLRTA